MILSALFLTGVLAGSCEKPALNIEELRKQLGELQKDTVYVYDTVYVVKPGETTATAMVSIQDFGVLPTNSADLNKINLQKAIDQASKSGLALYVTPVEGGYPMSGGLVLKKNVSLIGAHGPTGRGTSYTAEDGSRGPTGSLFTIVDNRNVFITVQSATQISGIQFYYPRQSFNNPANITAYPTTIKKDADSAVQGVTLRDLTFYGEYRAMDFRADKDHICEQILFENCYGYPLSGEFIAIDYCYDIPRILHCHVNPANMREFGRGYNKSVIDAVVAKKSWTYWVDHTDNAQFMDLFTFGVYGGIYLGPETYGQLTNFNLDCVNIGISKKGANTFNRNWQISQGSIIANIGASVNEIHPIEVTGYGHSAITNVECFSGNNGAVTNLGQSYDFLYVYGSGAPTIGMINCRMRNYSSSSPITKLNSNAKIVATACIDKNENIFEGIF